MPDTGQNISDLVAQQSSKPLYNISIQMEKAMSPAMKKMLTALFNAKINLDPFDVRTSSKHYHFRTVWSAVDKGWINRYFDAGGSRNIAMPGAGENGAYLEITESGIAAIPPTDGSDHA